MDKRIAFADGSCPSPCGAKRARQVSAAPVVPLIRTLCRELEARGIDYCHWKSNAMLDRSAAALNDLDLLVSRAHIQPFTAILCRLGFKPFHAPVDQQLPAVLDYYGYDEEATRFVHVHAHYQLVLGHDATKNYRVPVEAPYLESATQQELFKVPAPAFEYILMVLRMVLKHCTWEVVLIGQGALSSSERAELQYLRPLAAQRTLREILHEHLPYISEELFAACCASLEPDCPLRYRLATGRRLLHALRTHARRPHYKNVGLKLSRWLHHGLRRRLLRRNSGMRLSNGGIVVAIVGGDGAGKTTAVEEVCSWLSSEFEVLKLHMGKPGWSWTTTAVRGVLKMGRTLGFYPFMRAPESYTSDRSRIAFPGYPWLIREICTARDRCLSYIKARRFAAGGGLVVTDRFPLREVQFMDGPQGERMTAVCKRSRFLSRILSLEQNYYRRISPPDLLIVLRADPETSVQRKPDEDAAFVRARTAEIWNIDWRKAQAHVVDAGWSKTEVLAEIKRIIWSNL